MRENIKIYTKYTKYTKTKRKDARINEKIILKRDKEKQRTRQDHLCCILCF